MGLTVKKSFKGIDISEIRKMNALARENTINLGIGQLNEPLAPSVKKAGIDAFSKGHTRYTSNQGLLELREAVAKYESKKCNKEINSNQVIITNGAEGALWNILYTYLERGDSILIPEIAFSVYETISELQEASVQTYKLKNDFSINFHALVVQLSAIKNLKFIVLNSPNNPCGNILSNQEVKKLAQLADEWGFYIISDEIYSELIFSDKSFFSPLSYTDKVIVADGISKRASATGLRIGWTIAEEQISKPMIVANQYISTCASSVSQQAALACFDGSTDEFLDDVRRNLAKKGHYAYEFLKGIDDVEVVKPVGAFYIFPNISKWGDSKTVALKILEKCNVLTIPGLAFGEKGDDHIRISFAVDFDVLKEALEKIKNLLNEWDTYES